MLVPTPQSILDNDPTDDVFEKIVPTSELYYAEKRIALWSAYRYQGIGNTDEDYWINCMKDRASLIRHDYDLKMKGWFELYDRAITQNLGLDFTASHMESDSTVTSKHYDPPEVSTAGADADKYLNTQDSNANHFEQHNYSGLETETIKEYNRGLDNIRRMYADEFRDLFYWGI